MKTAWFVVMMLGACGGAPTAQKPANNVVQPPASSCETAVDAKIKKLEPAAQQRVRPDLVTACRDDHWPDAYVQCTSAGTAGCADSRTPEQQTRERNLIALAGMPPSCADYTRAMQNLARCQKLPPESRDAMQQAIDAMIEGWNFDDMPPDKKKAALDAAATACKQGADAMAQATKGAGC